VSTIRAYRCSDRFFRRSNELMDRNQSCSYPNIIANRWLSIRLSFFAHLMTCCVATFSVINEVSAGEAGLTISYSLSMTGALIWMIRMNSDLETNIVSVERILEYTNNEQEDEWVKPDSRPPRDWPASGAISVRQYSTKYRKDTDLVLRDISLDIKPREKIGVVGRTGSGKSSLSLSLFRILEPASGSILIDSFDIARFGLHDIRSRLTIIPQDPVLFSGTLRFNLDPLQIHTDLEIWRALELAHLRAYISTLSLGLDYQVSEYGENFSLGQRQLICLARAILRKTKILVLDEATASVDLETDAVVQRTIRDVFADCTIITIAHRLHTILDSDRILVLDAGRVLELGSPGELIRDERSAFASLVRDAGMDIAQLRAAPEGTSLHG
jgi:ATP-binding cassette subfamily C (CFTR/MRP) protein 1